MKKTVLSFAITCLSLASFAAGLVVSTMSPAEFQKVKSAKPQVFNAEIRPYNTYMGEFKDKKDTHIAVKIYLYNSKWDITSRQFVYGYAPNDRKIGKHLKEFLKDGAEHSVKIRVKFSKTETRDDVVIIDDFEDTFKGI